MTLRSLVRVSGDASVRWIAGLYFEVSYRLLAAPAGREFLRASAAPDAPAVHGYATSKDLDALLEALHPSPEDLLVDLGCGMGNVAIAIHRRAGCRVVGVDAAPRAVAEARRRAAEDDVGATVRFEVADLASPPVRGAAAYALDSLMFVRRPPQALALASRSLEPPGRVFATFVDHRGLGREAFARFIEGEGLRLERLDDVSAELGQRSRERAAVARRLLRGRPRWAGRLGLQLILAEEAIVAWLFERRRLRRWRFVVIQRAPGPTWGTTRPRRSERAYGDRARAGYRPVMTNARSVRTTLAAAASEARG